jgi:hypothetical protein
VAGLVERNHGCLYSANADVVVVVLLRNSSLDCVLGAFGGVAGHTQTGSIKPTVKSHDYESSSD